MTRAKKNPYDDTELPPTFGNDIFICGSEGLPTLLDFMKHIHTRLTFNLTQLFKDKTAAGYAQENFEFVCERDYFSSNERAAYVELTCRITGPASLIEFMPGREDVKYITGVDHGEKVTSERKEEMEQQHNVICYFSSNIAGTWQNQAKSFSRKLLTIEDAQRLTLVTPTELAAVIAPTVSSTAQALQFLGGPNKAAEPAKPEPAKPEPAEPEPAEPEKNKGNPGCCTIS